jgi:hypothetical protein
MQTPANTFKALPWSYSSLQAFETCPRRFYLTRVTKQVHEPMGAAMTHGNEVHKALENAIKGEAMLPHKFKSYQPLISKLLAAPGVKHAERKFALTDGFWPTDYWAPNAWVRGVIDFTLINGTKGTVLDWKTGKPKEDGDQLALFAGAAFAHYPQVDTFHTGYAWLAHDKLVTAAHTRNDVPTIWMTFLPRVKRMQAAVDSGDFPPKPSGLCRSWCPVGSKLCEFCGTN